MAAIWSEAWLARRKLSIAFQNSGGQVCTAIQTRWSGTRRESRKFSQPPRFNTGTTSCSERRPERARRSVTSESNGCVLSRRVSPRAAYALIDGEQMTIRRVEYDIEREARAFVAAECPTLSGSLKCFERQYRCRRRDKGLVPMSLLPSDRTSPFLFPLSPFRLS